MRTRVATLARLARYALLTVSLTALLTVPLTARGDIVGPPGDPARAQKIAGIVSADVGLAVLAGGVVMLALEATQPYAASTKDDLVVAGAVCTAIGGAAVIAGATIWLLARKRTAAWQAQKKQSARLELAPNGAQLRF